MKFTISIRALILSALALALGAATAFWASVVYQSTYQTILAGFDQKLQVLSEGAATLSDGDAHAQYQRPARISAMTLGPEAAWWAFDATRQRLVRLDSGDGGIVELLPPGPLPAIASLAFEAEPPRLWALLEDGSFAVWQVESSTPLNLVPADAALTDGLGRFDELLSGEGQLYARRGPEVFSLSAADEQPIATNRLFELSTEVSRLSKGEQGWWALSADRSQLLQLDPQGILQEETALTLDSPVQALLVSEGALYLAAAAMQRFDPQQASFEALAEPGFYSETHPFMATHQKAYRQIREAAGLTFLYTEVFFGDNQIRYIIDGSVGDDHTTPGYIDVVPDTSVEELVKAQTLGQPFVSDIRQWDLWGLIKVSGAPIRDAQGKVVAVAGADVDIGVIRSKTRRALFSVLLVGVGVLLLAGLVSIRIANGLTRPLRRIKDAALRLAAGYFGGQLATGSGDEIDQLASSLDRLSARVNAQQQQSQSYQLTLMDHRLRAALRHVLDDGVRRAGEGSGAELLNRQRAVAELNSDVVRAGELRLLWVIEAQVTELGRALARARIARLGRRLLSRLPVKSGLAQLLHAEPTLQACAALDAEGRLSVASRDSIEIGVEQSDGSCRQLRLQDGESQLITEDHAIVWNAEWRVALALPAFGQHPRGQA